MKVLHISGGGDTGGGKTHLLSLLPELKRSGWDVELVVFSPGPLGDEALAAGVAVHSLDVKHMMSATLLRRLFRLLRELKPDVVHTHGGRANFYGRIAARLVGIPYLVTTVHSHIDLDYSAPLPNWWFSTVDKMTRPLVDHFVVVSHDLRDALVRGGVSAQRIRVIHNGITPAEIVPLNLKAQFGLESPVICAVGRLVPIKRFDLLIRAMVGVLAATPTASLLLVGEGPLEGELKRLVVELGLENAVKFAGYRRDARHMIAGADVFVVSSDMEGLPIVVLEALAARVPVVATAVGGIPEIITPGVTGLLVPRGDVAGLAKAINTTWQGVNAAAERARAGWLWFNEHATARVMASQTAVVYRDLIMRRR